VKKRNRRIKKQSGTLREEGNSLSCGELTRVNPKASSSEEEDPLCIAPGKEQIALTSGYLNGLA
jgi:hypothetical protein